MSIIFDLKEDLSNLPQIVQRYEREMENAKEHLELQGKNLEEANREQPTWYCFYHQLLQDLKSMERLVENKKTQKRGKLWIQFKEQHSIALSSTDIAQYIESNDAYYQLNTFLLIIQELVGNMSALVKAFEQRGYTLRNLTQIRVHELQHALL